MRIATNTEVSNIQSQINQQLAILNRPGSKVEWASEAYFPSAILGEGSISSVTITIPSITTFSNRTYETIVCFMGSANPLSHPSSKSTPVLKTSLNLFANGEPGSYKSFPLDFGWNTNCGINLGTSINQLISGSIRAPYKAGTAEVFLYNATGWTLNFQENSSTESKMVAFIISNLNTTEVYQ